MITQPTTTCQGVYSFDGNGRRGQHVALGTSSTKLLTLPRRTFPWQVYVKALPGPLAAR